MRSIYFHEDGSSIIEILPCENFEFCLDEAKNILEFSQKNFNGLFFNELYNMKEIPIKLKRKEISIEQMDMLFHNAVQKYDEVIMGYDKNIGLGTNINAYGASDDTAVFCTHDNGIVSNIWLELKPHNEEDLEECKIILKRLSLLDGLLLVDWDWAEVYLLSEGMALENYLHGRLEIFRD